MTIHHGFQEHCIRPITNTVALFESDLALYSVICKIGLHVSASHSIICKHSLQVWYLVVKPDWTLCFNPYGFFLFVYLNFSKHFLHTINKPTPFSFFFHTLIIYLISFNHNFYHNNIT